MTRVGPQRHKKKIKTKTKNLVEKDTVIQVRILLSSSVALQLRVLAFSTIAFHLRRSCTCSAHFISFIFFRSFLTSSSHLDLGLPAGLPANDFHLCILFTMLVSGILFMCPNQLNRWVLTLLVMFRCLTNSSNSLFVLILHIPLASLVGPNIFLNIFLSNTESLCIILSLRTRGSQP